MGSALSPPTRSGSSSYLDDCMGAMNMKAPAWDLLFARRLLSDMGAISPPPAFPDTVRDLSSHCRSLLSRSRNQHDARLVAARWLLLDLGMRTKVEDLMTSSAARRDGPVRVLLVED